MTADPSEAGDDVFAKFDRLAPGYAAHDYADPVGYSSRRARVAVSLGPAPPPGATFLDLACGDANMAEPLLAAGYRYVGVDGSPGMIAAARARLGEGVRLDVGLLDEYVPPAPVDVTICLRAAYYPSDRLAFFERVADYTRVKFVFDLRPASEDLDAMLADLDAAGFTAVELRAFLLPQSRRLPSAAVTAISAIERATPLARVVTRRHGRIFCAARPPDQPESRGTNPNAT